MDDSMARGPHISPLSPDAPLPIRGPNLIPVSSTMKATLFVLLVALLATGMSSFSCHRTPYSP